MNHILKKVRHFVKTFIDDIVIKSRSFNEHFVYLRNILRIFLKYNISIKSTKIFLKYLNVVLLKQRVNALKLSTTNEKLKAITDLKFFDILKNLEHYFDFTKYIRNHIYYYAAIVKSLQNFKTFLLEFSFNIDFKRKKFTNKIKI